MTAGYLLMVAWTASPPASAASTDDIAAVEAVAAEAATAVSVDDLQKTYRKLIRATARHRDPDPREFVEDLVVLYHGLRDVPGLSHAESSRMRGAIKGRLEQLRDRLHRERKRTAESRARAERRLARTPRAADSATGGAGGRTAALNGGGELAAAQKLIDLIQNTIEPDSWQVNGGRGTISYYAPLRVLVIRQTGEVHHQLGGALQQLHP